MCCFVKQKTAYDMRISDWSSDVGSSDLAGTRVRMSLGAKSRRRRRPQADAGGHLPPRAFAPGAPVVKAATLSPHRLRRALTRRFAPPSPAGGRGARSEEHTSELQSLMRISYAVFFLIKKYFFFFLLLFFFFFFFLFLFIFFFFF